MDFPLLIILGYFIGSIPFGVLIGKLFLRIDVRDYGSGKMGMTNVMRTVNVPAAMFVLMLDMGKGILMVSLARIISDAAALESASALAALVGHNWPIFSGFRGGRGIATGWGSLLILWPPAGLAATFIGLPVVGISRYVSLGAVIATVGGCAVLIFQALSGIAPLGYMWFAIIGGVLVVVRHKGNIQRLLKGEERKIGKS